MTVGHKSYADALRYVFGTDVDYAQIVKVTLQGVVVDNENRYASQKSIPTTKRRVIGRPKSPKVSTSYVERQNLTIRMCIQWYTRKTNAFSKKLKRYMNMLNIFFVYYNVCQDHWSLKVTPAMAAGLTDARQNMYFIVDLLEARESEIDRSRGPYKEVTSK